MDSDLNTPNARPAVRPAKTARAQQHRQRSPLRTRRANTTMRVIDRAAIAFALVPEARQTYPAEDDCTTRAAAHGTCPGF